eukprot:g3726.t1
MSKRKRATEECVSASTEHMSPENAWRGQIAVGGSLRLNIASCLKPFEAEILDTMLEAVKLSNSGTVVRVAGGWVRDKLLGLENEDIDIALDNCTGVAFAEMVNAYLKSQGQDEGKIGVIEANPEQSKHLETARMKVKGVWVDLVNLRTEVYRSDSRIPEASLGTPEEDALRRDFTLNALFYNVNNGKIEDKTGRGVDDLRDGIIRTPLSPMITFRDDPLRVLRAVRFAARFGFTLHEDLCAAAKNDEIQAALRTKVSPERVGAELSGMISGKMAQPALALSILQELGLSRAVYAPPEHLVPPMPIGGFDWSRGTAVARAAARLLAFRSTLSEVEGPKTEIVGVCASAAGSMEGADNEAEASGPVSEKAGTSVNQTNTFTCDGTQESRETSNGGDGEDLAMEASKGTRVITGDTEGPGDGKGKEPPATLPRELFLCAALLPLTGVKHKTKKGKLVPAAQSVVSDSLKLKAKEAKNVADILELWQTFRSLADANAASSGDTDAAGAKMEGAGNTDKAGFSRLSVGLAVRQAKEAWPTCVDLSCAVEMCGLPPPPQGADATGATAVAESGRNTPQACGDSSGANKGEDLRDGSADQAVIEKYSRLRKAVARMGLERAWDITPLLRGNELMVELQLPKGPEIGKQMSRQISWQLEHPTGTRKECVDFLRATFSS